MAESDDYADHSFLEKLVARLEAEPKSVLCYCRSWRVSAEGELSGYLDSTDETDRDRWAKDFVADGREECRRSLSQRNTIPNASAVVFRREVYERAGGADERLRLCGDWKLWSAMALMGDISYVKDPLNYFRFHESSVRVQGERMGIEASESLEVIRSIVRGMLRNGSDGRVKRMEFPTVLLDGYRRGMDILEQSDPSAALSAIDEFLQLTEVNTVSKWEIADALLRASRIHYRLGRPGRALLLAGRAFLVRPAIGGRPVKRLLVGHTRRTENTGEARGR